ncbi:MAG TPA: o-succinylbenzoate--CoA ligase [Candidatus Limnocylindrales bacterium]|nr:o-succinylbenzoate--CoA ligase [Candidatus Limnocylindrales bacterium]
MTAALKTPWLADRARERPDDVALCCDGERISWSSLAARAESLAEGFSRLGVGRGDIVAVRSAPSPEMVAALHAVQRLGAAMLPVNTRLARPEAERILSHALPRLLVDTISGERADPGDVRVVDSFADVARAGARSSCVPARIDGDAALAVVFTSGTTGAPKGVVLTNANFAASADGSRRRLGHGAGDTWLATMPLFHVGGLSILARSALEGSTVVLEDGFDAARCAAVLTRGDATMISLVPTMLHRVLEHTFDVSARVRAVLVGGAALPAVLARRALDRGLPVAATYGMTEACSQIATGEPGSIYAAQGRTGKALDGVDIRIEPIENGEHAGGWGQILVRGPGVARGYLRNPAADRAAFRRGWLATGDIGRLGEDRALEVSGRLDDLIVSGGENVSPNEVERVLEEHRDVAESMVIGEPDDEWGQKIVALVVLRRTGVPPPEDEIRGWCRGRLAAYKIPREVRVVGDLPRNATGKLLRKRA